MERAYLSESDGSDEGSGMEQAFGGRCGVFHDTESESDEEGGEYDRGLEYAPNGVGGPFQGSDDEDVEPVVDCVDFTQGQYPRLCQQYWLRPFFTLGVSKPHFQGQLV